MNKIIYFIAQILIFIMQKNYPMRIHPTILKKAPSFFKTITAVEKPLCLFPLANDQIIIIGTEKGILYDTKEEKIITKFISQFNTQNNRNENENEDKIYTTATVNKEQNKLAVFRFDTRSLEIYTIPHGEIIYSQKTGLCCGKPIFHSDNKTVFMIPSDEPNKLIPFNYKNTDCPEGNPFFVNLFANYKSSYIPCLIANPITNHTTFLYEHDIIKIWDSYYSVHQKYTENLRNGKYSDDEKFLVLNYYTGKTTVLNTTSKKEEILIPHGHIAAMAFLPHSYILATITLQEDKVCFWNILTKKRIDSTISFGKEKYLYFADIIRNENQAEWGSHCTHQELICFSYDGTKIFVAFINGVKIFPSPFDVQYQPDAKEKCLFALQTLNVFNNTEMNKKIPQEINHYIIQIMLKTLKGIH